MAGNDLNIKLSTEIVKLKPALDTSRESIAELKRQVGEITKKLEDKHVKLNVELHSTIKDLSRQIGLIQTNINNSANIKPIKIDVQFDVKGSAVRLKNQLEDVYKEVKKYNDEFARSIQNSQNKVAKSLSKHTQPTNSNISGFNYTQFADSVGKAEKLMRDKFGKNGVFSSIESKDAEGFLNGFVAQLQRTNGIVYKMKYNWDKDAKKFSPINQTTVNTTQKYANQLRDSLAKTYDSIQKLQDGGGKSKLLDNFSDLEKRFSQNSLTKDAVKGLDRLIRLEKQYESEIKKEQAEINKRNKLLIDIGKYARSEYNKSGNKDTVSQMIQLRRQAKDTSNSVEDIRVEFSKIKSEIELANQKGKIGVDIAKKRLELESKLNTEAKKIKSNDSSSLGIEKEAREMIKLAKSAEDYLAIERKLATLKTNNSNIKDLERTQKLQKDIEKRLIDWSMKIGRNSDQISASIGRIPEVAKKGTVALEKMYDSLGKKLETFNKQQTMLRQEQSKILADASKSTRDSSVVGNVTHAVKQGDIDALEQYIGEMLKGKVANVKTRETTDELQRAVTRMQVTMAGTGKTVKTYTIDLDHMNKVLRQSAEGTDYNANRNLGFFEQMKVAMARVPIWMASMTAFYGSLRAVQNMSGEIIEIDKQLTELRRVANSNINIDTIFEGAVDTAQRLGNNIHDVLDTMNEFSRTFGDFNERQLLAITNTATLMSNVSDLSASDAGRSLVGTMNAFNISAEDSIHIVDALNEVDNQYAISTQQLAEGLQKASATSATFGMNMEETVGAITAIGSVTMESGAIIGNAIKTIESRITTLDDAGTILEGVGVKIHTMTKAGEEIRPVADIMDDLGKKWRTLTDEQRQNIGVTLAGRNQLSRFLAWMNNYETAIEATATAYNSQGSALRENEKYLTSFEARINQLKNSFTEVSIAIGEAFLSDGILTGIEMLKSLADVAITVTKNFGALPIVFGATSAVLMKMGVFNKLKDNINGALDATNKFTNSVKNIGWAESFKKANTAISETEASIKRTDKATVVATGSARAFGVALKGALVSTGIGAGFALLGVLVEKFTKKLAESKRQAEEVKKSIDSQVKSYHEYGNSYEELISKYEKLDEKMKSGKLEDSEMADYLDVTNKIANAMPSAIKSVDANGQAHLKSADSIREEAKRVKELADAQDDLKLKQQGLSFADYAKKVTDANEEVKDLSKTLKRLKSEDGKDQEYGGWIGKIVQPKMDNKDAIIEYENKKQIAMQKSAEMVQLSIKGIQEYSRLALNHKGVYKDLSDEQIAMVENFATANHKSLEDVKGDEKKYNAEMVKLKNESVKLGEQMSDSYKRMVKNLGKDATTTQINELKKNLNTAFSAIPEELLDKAGRGFKGVEDNIKGVTSVVEKLRGGNVNFDGMVESLKGMGMSSKDAKEYVTDLGFEIGNQKVKAELAGGALGDYTDQIQEMTDETLKAIDPIKELLGVTADTGALSSLKSYLDGISISKNQYGDAYKASSLYRESVMSLTSALGISQKQADGNYDALYNLVIGLNNVEQGTKKNGEAFKDTSKLTKYQKSLYEKYIKTLDDGHTYQEAVISAVGIETKAKEKNTEATKENTNASKDNSKSKDSTNTDKDSKSKEKNAEKARENTKAIKDLDKAYKDLQSSGSNNGDSQTSYLKSVNKQLTTIKGKYTAVKDANGDFKLQMEDGSKSKLLDNINQQLKDADLSIGVTKDKHDDLVATVINSDGTSTTLGNVKKDSEDAGKKLDEVKDKAVEIPSIMANTNFNGLALGLDGSVNKIDYLLEGFKNVNKNIVTVDKSISGLSDSMKNVVSYADSMTSVTTEFDTIKVKVADLITAIDLAKLKMSNMFSGVKISSDLTGAIASANKSINSLVSHSNKGRSAIAKLGRTLSGLAGLSVGSLPKYSKQISILSSRLNTAKKNSNSLIKSQKDLAKAYSRVVSVTKAYGKAVSSAGAGASKSYSKMASSIVKNTSIVKAQYKAHGNAIKTLQKTVEKSMSKIVASIKSGSKKSVSAVSTMASQMREKFKSGLDEMVKDASSLPSRIGQGIRENMASASNSMDALAKDMVKRFKSELGIHSPSRVFQELGGFVVQGLEKGLTGSDLKSLGTSVFDDFGGGVFDSMDMIKAYLTNDFGNIAGGSVDAFKGVATKALLMTNQYSDANLNALLYQMQTESGGNPKAINLWDSNAKKGTPSKGLMQVIDPTFKTHAMKGFNTNIYDPLSNIIASIRYAVSRYGSLAKAYQGHGYANGGFVDKKELAWHGEEGEEVIIPLIQKRRQRGIDLWVQAGKKLGVDHRVLEMLSAKSNGGMAFGSGGVGASSGEGGDTSGGGDSGSSGIMQQSIYDANYDFGGNIDFTALASKKSVESSVYKSEIKLSKTTSGLTHQLDILSAKMAGLPELTKSYNNRLIDQYKVQKALVASLKKDANNQVKTTSKLEKQQDSASKKEKQRDEKRKTTKKQNSKDSSKTSKSKSKSNSQSSKDYKDKVSESKQKAKDLETQIIEAENTLEEIWQNIRKNAFDSKMEDLGNKSDAISNKIATLESKMDTLDETSVSYRDNLKSLIKYQNSYVKSLTNEKKAVESRNKQIQTQLKSLKKPKNRNEVNRKKSLQDELVQNNATIETLTQNITNANKTIKDKTSEIFTNWLTEIDENFTTAIDKIQRNIDRIDFKIKVSEYFDDTSFKDSMNMLIDKAKETQKKQATAQKEFDEIKKADTSADKKVSSTKKSYDVAKTKSDATTKVNKSAVAKAKTEYDKAVKKYGKDSKKAKSAKAKYDNAKSIQSKTNKVNSSNVSKTKKAYSQAKTDAKNSQDALDKAEEGLQNSVIDTLEAEKAIKDKRAEVADAGIQQLKDYYSAMKDMATSAIDAELDSLEKAHTKKMDLYDKEIDKINAIYDAKLKEIDKQVDEEDYQAELADKTKTVTDLKNKIAILSRDNSLEGKKALKEAQDSLKEAQSDLDKTQRDRTIENKKSGIEAQRDEQLNAINGYVDANGKYVEGLKDQEDEAYKNKVDSLEAEKKAVEKHYDDLLNNDKKWAEMRKKYISGSFSELNTELGNMSSELAKLQQGDFDGLTTSFSTFSKEVKAQFAELNKLTLDNLVYNSKEVVKNAKEQASSKGYNFTDGKVSSGSGSKVTTPPKTTPPPKPPAKPPANTPPKKDDTKKETPPKGGSSSSSGSSSSKSSSSSSSSNNRKTTTSLNMRSSAGYGNNVITVLKAGTAVEYLGMSDGWAKIKYNKKTGYVGSSYLKKFDTGGYTGDNVPKQGALAILHKKELILNERQTENLLNTVKLMDGVMSKSANVMPNSYAKDYRNTDNSNTSQSNDHYEFNVKIENLQGGKQGAEDLIKHLNKERRKLGRF